MYKDLLESVGEEIEAPREAHVVDVMECLANELATVSEYMTIGQEYASFESIHAFAQALEECGCDHLEKFEVKEPQTLLRAGKRFFMGSGAPGAGTSHFLGPP